ncbi:MAG: hypothetical protein K0R75_2477, partial [Paenibacillaceae bacterium]|nr:hypothetical protein [Paenibacillaceae bacterium]
MGNTNGEKWSFGTHAELFQATTGTAGSDLNIVRLALGEQFVEWEWRYDGDKAQAAGMVFKADMRRRGEQEWLRTIDLERGKVARVDGLENGVDYELQLRALERGASGDAQPASV